MSGKQIFNLGAAFLLVALLAFQVGSQGLPDIDLPDVVVPDPVPEGIADTVVTVADEDKPNVRREQMLMDLETHDWGDIEYKAYGVNSDGVEPFLGVRPADALYIGQKVDGKVKVLHHEPLPVEAKEVIEKVKEYRRGS